MSYLLIKKGCYLCFCVGCVTGRGLKQRQNKFLLIFTKSPMAKIGLVQKWNVCIVNARACNGPFAKDNTENQLELWSLGDVWVADLPTVG